MSIGRGRTGPYPTDDTTRSLYIYPYSVKQPFPFSVAHKTKTSSMELQHRRFPGTCFIREGAVLEHPVVGRVPREREPAYCYFASTTA